jgi:hypothetical protein
MYLAYYNAGVVALNLKVAALAPEEFVKKSPKRKSKPFFYKILTYIGM